MEQKLHELIEQVRARMVEVAMTKRNLLDREVIELSELLDSLIYMSQLLKQNKALNKGRAAMPRMASLDPRYKRKVPSLAIVESGRRTRNRLKRTIRRKDYSSASQRRIRRRRSVQVLEHYYRRSIGGMASTIEPIRARSSRT